MRLVRILIVFILMFSKLSHAQEWEVGSNIGMMGYIGDLNRNNPAQFTNLAASIHVRYALTPYHGFKLAFTQGGVKGSDQDAKSDFEKARNLSFKSNITEIALNYEYYFYPFVPGSGKNRYTLYAFAGIAGFRFEPLAEFNGSTYKLRELGTEGQGTSFNSSAKYDNLALAIPFGVGFKYNFIDNFNLGFELGYRNTFTDYLDDVSKTYADKDILTNANGQISALLSDRSGEINNGVYTGETYTERGDASRRDFYMFAGITISYTFTPIKCPKINIYK
jgi:Domain of unknown function (DUF6089)